MYVSKSHCKALVKATSSRLGIDAYLHMWQVTSACKPAPPCQGNGIFLSISTKIHVHMHVFCPLISNPTFLVYYIQAYMSVITMTVKH